MPEGDARDIAIRELMRQLAEADAEAELLQAALKRWERFGKRLLRQGRVSINELRGEVLGLEDPA